MTGLKQCSHYLIFLDISKFIHIPNIVGKLPIKGKN